MEAALKAIAAPHRRQILSLVRDDELSAGEIAKNFDAAFGEHLSVPGIPISPAMKAAVAAAAQKKA